MPYDNLFLVGVAAGGYAFLMPPKPGTIYSDKEMVELAALIIAMKPRLREQFEEALTRMK